jgi:hypothetical protein
MPYPASDGSAGARPSRELPELDMLNHINKAVFLARLEFRSAFRATGDNVREPQNRRVEIVIQ